MIGERENSYSDTNYGTLVMRAFDIEGNEINAFFDSKDNLVFVLDNTINAQKPNVLLVINPDGDKKWDEILSGDYDVDLETIRPKVDNKYQKLDIEYSGLPVYENLINAYNAGEGLEEPLNQLSVLRDSAARHSAMMRLNVANETISKTNATIVKTKESIVRLETRIKTLRSKLSATKKEVGKVNTKQSASKILKLESQIEATNEKLKRAKKRLESAQKRLEVATVDAELASELLNQPPVEIKQQVKNKPIVVAPKYPVQKAEEDVEEADDEESEEEILDEEIEESDVKPLFQEDPQILNEDIAFKPISFDAPLFKEPDVKEKTTQELVVKEEPMVPVAESKPVLESITPIEEPVFTPVPVPMTETTEIVEEKPEITEEKTEDKIEISEEKPVLETMVPVSEDIEFVEPQMPAPVDDTETQAPVAPVSPVAPITPALNNFQEPVEIKQGHSKPGVIYYVLLLVLILLSVFTLWLYQKNMSGKDTAPVLAAKTQEVSVLKPTKKVEKVEPKKVEEPETVFLDEEPEKEPVEETVKPVEETVEPVVEEESEAVATEEPNVEPEIAEEPEYESEPTDEAPFVEDVVPSRLNTSGMDDDEETKILTEEEILARKPVYEPGAKYDDMFVSEEDFESGFVEEDDESDSFLDEEFDE